MSTKQIQKKIRPRGSQQTPSFSVEFELKTNPFTRRILRSRFEAGRQLYNAILDDALSRLTAAKRDKNWTTARDLPPGTERTLAFKKIRLKYGLTEYSMHKHSSLKKDTWVRGHIDISTGQKIATRAWLAVEQYMYGKKGKPYFISKHEPLRSLEGKTSRGIRYNTEKRSILWDSRDSVHGKGFKIELPLIIDMNDEYHVHAFKHQIKYVRILRKTIRGRERWFAQLILKGAPLTKYVKQAGDIGIDIGPSTVAIVSDNHSEITKLVPKSENKTRAKRRYQRKIDRQRRSNNPENFNENGTIKPKSERKPWKTSSRQRRLQGQLKELERKQAAQRKNSHGNLSNQIMGYGNRIHAEKISVESWQQSYFGRNIINHAPSLLLMLLKRKAETYEEINTYDTCLSQICLCGKKVKKPLSQRQHTCGCEYIPIGYYVQRDIFSAYLAKHTVGSNFDQQSAQNNWVLTGANCLLQPLNTECKGELFPFVMPKHNVVTTDIILRQKSLAENGNKTTGKAQRENLDWREPLADSPLQKKRIIGRQLEGRPGASTP